MKIRLATLAVVIGLSFAWLLTPTHHLKSVIAASPAHSTQQAPSNPCEFPSKNSITGMSDAEIAWRLFVAAACPVANDPNAMVTWEQWQTQSQVFPPSKQLGAPPPSRFHPSVLQQIMNPGSNLAELNVSTAGCKRGQNPAYPGGPHRMICEEVRLNPDAATYVTSNKLETHAGQGAFVKNSSTFDFPGSAIEVKADWVQQKTMSLCDNPPNPPTVHVEKATDSKGVAHCYALAGIHINSKLINNWVWATWEPQDNTQNPMRCFELGCADPWGASPATLPPGQKSPPVSAQSAGLAAIMKQAGLAPEWSNYRMDGVQTVPVDQNKPTLLGNSVTEAESVGLALNQASCITCHHSSSVNSSGADGIKLLTVKGKKSPLRPIGAFDKNPPTNNPGYVTRDFVWTFVVAP